MKQIIISFFLSTSVLAIGKITKVKGRVSLLYLGTTEPIKAKKGMKVRKDTSIVTKSRSFVRITMNDKSKVSLGPNSKMVVNKVETRNAGFVSLLKGSLRSNVPKKDNNNEKLFIKTRTASLGVRGTEFQAMYNPKNKITNLITFKGNVALKKTKSGDVVTVDKIAKELKSKGVVEVKNARFSSVSSNLKKATVPVKISPVQYTLLKINKELATENVKVKKEEYQKELRTTKEEYKKISKEEVSQKKSAGREFDISKQEYRPTSGGFVDLNSGIYVPPIIKKEAFNKELNIYETKTEIGKVNTTGNYVPPKGLKLDAVKGFIAESKQAKTVVTKLNNEIKGQIVKPLKPSEDDLELDNSSAYDRYFPELDTE